MGQAKLNRTVAACKSLMNGILHLIVIQFESWHSHCSRPRKMSYLSLTKVVSSRRSASTRLLCAAALALAFFAPQARAALYMDHDVILKTLSSYSRSHYGNFNILNQGYDPDAEQVIWAGVAFVFVGMDNQEESV